MTTAKLQISSPVSLNLCMTPYCWLVVALYITVPKFDGGAGGKNQVYPVNGFKTCTSILNNYLKIWGKVLHFVRTKRKGRKHLPFLIVYVFSENKVKLLAVGWDLMHWVEVPVKEAHHHKILVGTYPPYSEELKHGTR